MSAPRPSRSKHSRRRFLGSSVALWPTLHSCSAKVVGVQRSPITFAVEQGKGHLQIGTSVDAELEPYLGTTGAPTTLHDTIFSTIAGAPAYVGKAPRFTMTNTGLGVNVDLQNHN